MSKVHYELFFHFTWHTKNDINCIDVILEQFLYPCIGQKCKQEGYHLLAVNGTENHLHVLLSLRPNHLLSNVANMLKGSSSHDTNNHFQSNKTLYWQSGYGVLTVSHCMVPKIIEYINNQKIHHKKGDIVQEYEQCEGSTEPC